MPIQITYYLDVVSSWCYWAEPAWQELKKRFPEDVEFTWKIALLDASGLPASAAQEDWFYRRSGTITRSPFLLSSGWLDLDLNEYLAPNCVAEAGRDFGINDDRIRLALAKAAMRDGLKVGRWDVASEIAARAANLAPAELMDRARSPQIEERVRASTAEFHALKVTQRPAFLIEDPIADRAVFSGLWTAAPLIASLEAMRSDCEGYASFRAHFGLPPAQ